MTVVGQRKQDVRRTGKARTDLVVVLLDQLDQILGSFRLDVLGEHIQVQRQHIGGLELFLRLAVAVGQHTAIGIRHLAAQFLVLGGVLGLAKDACNFGQRTAGVAQGRRGGVLAARLPLAHLRHIGGDPVAEMQHRRCVPDVTVLADAESRPEAARLDVLLHGGVHHTQYVQAARGLVQSPRHQHTGVAPPVHGHLGHCGGETVALHGHGVRDAAGGQLLGLDVAQPLLQKAAQFKVVQRGGREHGNISGPAHALVALGAVRRYINEI